MDREPRPRLSDLTRTELLARAVEYRQMAATALTADTRDALLELAERFEEKAIGHSGNDNQPVTPAV